MNRRAISVTLLAALVPKCPLCIAGVLAAFGVGGIGPAVVGYLSPTVLLALSVLALGVVVVYFAWHKGVAGGVVATAGAALILLGRQVWPSTSLLLCGTAVVTGYVIVDARRARSCCTR